MIDGLEISEVYFSGLNKEFRIDSEYYKKIFLADDLFLINKGSKTINCFVTDGQHGYHELDETSPIHMLTAKNTKMWFADILGADLIAKWVDENNKRSSLQENDLILSTRGSVGYCAIVKPDVLPANIDQDVARIKILDEKIFPEYLLTYLNCCFGQDWMKRNKTGMVQQGLSLQKVREIPVPILSRMFQNYIADIINLAYEKKTASIKCVEEAESLLNDNIEINYNIQESISIKTLSESFNISGRLDAEYYQPKYDELFAMLSKHKSKNLGGKDGLVSIKKSIEPGSEAYREEGVPFVRVSDIDKFEITSPEIKLPQDIVPNIEILYPKKDTILLSKDGSVGIAHKVQEDLDVVTSGALLHLTVKNINEILPDYLTLVLNSPIVQLQAERDCNGAIIQHWKPGDIEKVVIPILDMEKQIEIADKVQESFRLRKKSKKLLDIAVKAVEMAIETDEETAIAWMKEQGV